MDAPLTEKIELVARRIYGADGVDFAPEAAARLAELEKDEATRALPVCIAKTQYSLSDDQTRLGRPTGFRITVREVYLRAGAGFVVALTGKILLMPGLGKTPAAEGMTIDVETGTIRGLF